MIRAQQDMQCDRIVMGTIRHIKPTRWQSSFLYRLFVWKRPTYASMYGTTQLYMQIYMRPIRTTTMEMLWAMHTHISPIGALNAMLLWFRLA